MGSNCFGCTLGLPLARFNRSRANGDAADDSIFKHRRLEWDGS